MTVQNNPAQYAQATQAQLQSILGNTIPVYEDFNRNFATEPEFLTWMIRNIHQPVYTGPNQSVKGIDRPTIQINVFTQRSSDAWNITNTILQSLHGYSGLYGGATYGFQISKADVDVLYKTYDNTVGLHHVIMDCTLDIPA